MINIPFKITFSRIFLGFLTLFVLIFGYRFGIGFTKNGSVSRGNDPRGSFDFFESNKGLRKNYASEKTGGSKMPNFPIESTQKYEKTASLAARTNSFEQEERAIRLKTKIFEAIIQFENRSGNAGERELQLMIGVKPELFDSFYTEIQKIGLNYSNSITKVDKTTEFRELNGKKVSFEKALANLNDLKNRAGSISDLVGLHEKILDVERQMQELGVELGNFSAENEFCTVRFSLNERAGARDISIASRILGALEWALIKFSIGILLLIGLLLTTWLLLLVVNKLNSEVK